jgi:hypothetical protein
VLREQREEALFLRHQLVEPVQHQETPRIEPAGRLAFRREQEKPRDTVIDIVKAITAASLQHEDAASFYRVG